MMLLREKTSVQSTSYDVFLSFLKGADPIHVNICLCEPSEQLEGYTPGFTLVFSCGFGGSRAGKKSIYFSTNHFCVD